MGSSLKEYLYEVWQCENALITLQRVKERLSFLSEESKRTKMKVSLLSEELRRAEKRLASLEDDIQTLIAIHEIDATGHFYCDDRGNWHHLPEKAVLMQSVASLTSNIVSETKCESAYKFFEQLAQSAIPFISNLISETNDCVNKLYQFDIIHPKYRHSITIIASLFDYLDTGRTNFLVRKNSDPGAYNLYEEDVRNNRVIDAIATGFSELSYQLSEIRKNQYSLYQAIQKSNTIFSDIFVQLNRISDEIRKRSKCNH